MRKITFFTLVCCCITTGLKPQSLNQPANWPNPNWSLGGVYNSTGLFHNPTTNSSNFAFDDDFAGIGSNNTIYVESPAIDLTSAVNAGDNAIRITLSYVYRQLITGTEILQIQYWDADANFWTFLTNFSPNTTTTTDYLNCNYVTGNSPALDISGFTPNQLTGFRYRLVYDDDNQWAWGWCFGSPTISSFSCTEQAPYNEGFENGIPSCLTVSNIVGDFDWFLGNGPTPSTSTGPVAASIPTVGTDMVYVYAEASGSAVQGDVSRLEMPNVDISGLASPELSFEYHMYGADMGQLVVQIDIGNGFTYLDAIVGEQQTSSGAAWLTKRIDLSAFSGVVKIGFLVTRGTSFNSDIAIDDISIDNAVGIAENNIEENVDLYPNPTTGIFNLKIEDIDTEGLVIQVIDSKGKLIHVIDQAEGYAVNEQIDLSGYAKGLYFVKVNSREGTITKKVVLR